MVKQLVTGGLWIVLVSAAVPMGLLIIAHGIESHSAQAQSTTTVPVHSSCNNATSMEVAVPKISQEIGLPWCWAASAQNVMNSSIGGMNANQCDLVGSIIGKSTCCDPKLKYSDCNSRGFAEWVLSENGFSFTPKVGPPPDSPPYDKPPISWIDATKEICEGRPFISWISNPDSHQLVVVGYSIVNGPELSIFDPAVIGGVTAYMPYNDFVAQASAFNDWNWTHWNDTKAISK